MAVHHLFEVEFHTTTAVLTEFAEDSRTIVAKDAEQAIKHVVRDLKTDGVKRVLVHSCKYLQRVDIP